MSKKTEHEQLRQALTAAQAAIERVRELLNQERETKPLRELGKLEIK